MEASQNYYDEVSGAFDGWSPTDYSHRIKIREERVLVAGDAHLPYADHELLRLLRESIHKYDIKCVLWLGDLMDMQKFSKYGQTDYSVTWQQEKSIVSDILTQIDRDLEKTCGYQVWSRGNHDYRWVKQLADHENMQGLACSISPQVANLVGEGRLVTSDNPTLEGVPDGKGDYAWVFTHPARFSNSLFAEANKMSLLEHKHVMTAHSHNFGVGVGPTGNHFVAEAGGLFDAKHFEYVQRAPSGMRKMASGFHVILGPDEMPTPIYRKKNGLY